MGGYLPSQGRYLLCWIGCWCRYKCLFRDENGVSLGCLLQWAWEVALYVQQNCGEFFMVWSWLGVEAFCNIGIYMYSEIAEVVS